MNPFTTLAALFLAATAADKGEAPTVLEARFLGTNAQGALVETTVIRHRPGVNCYNWVIVVAPENRSVSVREVFELPGAAQNWDSEPTGVTVVNRAQTGAVTEFPDSLEDGVLTHGWCVAEGDPVGPHRIRVFVGDRLLHDFRFTIIADSY